MGVDLRADLGPLSVELAAHMERLHAAVVDALDRPHAHFQLIPAGAVSGAGTKPLIADFGSPAQGQLWIPQFLEVFGPDPFGAAIAAVTAAAFVGPLPSLGGLTLGPPVTGLDLNGVRLTSLAVPSTNQFPDKSPVFPNEQLYAIFAGTGLVAGGANYHALLGVLCYPLSDEALTW